jgi:hypothetical protein
MDIPPTNELVSINILEKYIEKYPEDAEKWLEFIKDPAEEQLNMQSTYPNIDINAEIYKIYEELHTIEAEKPIDHYKDGCIFCKKSWASTDGVPTITLICGHKFHTVCSMIDQYQNDLNRCIVPDCDINTWEYVRKIVRSKEKLRIKTQNILLESFEKRNDFKKDLKILKKNVSNVSKNHNEIKKLMSNGQKLYVHKHLYSLNQMQNDLNEGVKNIKNSEEMHKYKQSVREYRKNANVIFRKYHVSFRELTQRGLLRASWRIRWLLERHRNPINYYKMGIRMYPGRMMWKDTLDQSDDEDDAVDIPPAMMRAGLERLEQDDQDDQENI